MVLVAEVYREANRPAYLPRYHSGPPVNSIQAALMLLGQNGMRMLLARVAFRPIVSMQSGRLARRAAPLIWRQSEKSALAASLLAPGLGADPFEAYLAGLMHNVGLVVAFRITDQVCQEQPLPQPPDFCAGLLASGRALSAAIARHWAFPASVVHAIAQAGRGDAGPLPTALAQGDLLARLRVLQDAGMLAEGGALLHGLTPAQRRCFDKLRIEEN
jgi:HD-like signal output (HDOD) protein